MDTITLIVDAPTLIDRIHGLKQWIYDGSIRITVPKCTLEEVERQHKASLIPKEVPKEPSSKRASGRAPRRGEQPLFDINPRTAWEFLCREQSEAHSVGVSFAKEDEEFSQWKEEEQKARLEEGPPPAPTSFADALLRKLNITEGPSPNVAKGPTKPKLVSKATDSKSPWKIQKVPIIPSEGIPSNLKPFFSYALWRLYEAPKDPLQPTKHIIFADGVRMKNIAAILGIQIRDWAELRRVIVEEFYARDHRATSGQLEKDFPNRTIRAKAGQKQRAQPDQDATTEPTDAHVAGSTPQGSTTASPSNGEAHVDAKDEIANVKKDLANLPVSSVTRDHVSPSINGSVPGAIPKVEPDTPKADEHRDAPKEGAPTVASEPAMDVASAKLPEENKKEESELDSDEEIIVFNPRSKRSSTLRPRTPGGTSEPSQSRPTTANGSTKEVAESPKPAKSPIKSTLKPQSPVFTPGQLYTPVGGFTEAGARSTFPPPANGYQATTPKTIPRSPPSGHPDPSSAQHTSQNGKAKQSQSDEARRQQSEIILQRQREAIQRQSKATAKPPPRKIQMEPTDHPIIIDPDDFDRSYVIQPPSQQPERGGKKRGGGRQRPTSRGNGSQTKGQKAEPEEEFVLKSGAPRGSTRGKGKLFVP